MKRKEEQEQELKQEQKAPEKPPHDRMIKGPPERKDYKEA
jgi:hypothetical protein